MAVHACSSRLHWLALLAASGIASRHSSAAAQRVVLAPGGTLDGGAAALIAQQLTSVWEFWDCEPLPPPSVLERVEAVIIPPGGGRCGAADVLGAVAEAVGDRTLIGGGPILCQHMLTGISPAAVAAVPAEFAVANVHPSSVPLAEYVLAAMLQSRTQLSSLSERFRGCTWKTAPPGNHGCPSMMEEHGALFGTSMCILGYGHIGVEVAKRAAAFGVAVSGTTVGPPATPPQPLQRLTGPSRQEAEECVTGADFVVVALPLNAATAGLVDARMLSLMGPQSMLINPARGAIVDEQALFTALRDGVIHAAALDVWWHDIDTLSAEHPQLSWMVDNATGPDAWPSELPFNQLPEVIMTPHLAQKTNVEASARIAELAQQLDRLARNEQPENLLRPGNVPFPAGGGGGSAQVEQTTPAGGSDSESERRKWKKQQAVAGDRGSSEERASLVSGLQAQNEE